jgi:hypothetical protein
MPFMLLALGATLVMVIVANPLMGVGLVCIWAGVALIKKQL